MKPWGSFRINNGRCGGLSLIEVLVALLVLSIGLVGLAALHLNSLKFAHSSYYRSLASTIALNLEERLWNEVSMSMLDNGDICLSGTDGEESDNGGGDSLVGGALGNIRDVLQQDWASSGGARSSNWNWTEGTYAMLPGLEVEFGGVRQGCVSRAPEGMDGRWADRWIEIPLRLTWNEGRFEENAEPERFDYVARMSCVSEWIAGADSDPCASI